MRVSSPRTTGMKNCRPAVSKPQEKTSSQTIVSLDKKTYQHIESIRKMRGKGSKSETIRLVVQEYLRRYSIQEPKACSRRLTLLKKQFNSLIQTGTWRFTRTKEKLI